MNGKMNSRIDLMEQGQLISKGIQFSQETNEICLSQRLGQKFEFSSSFFGRIEDTKKAFWNYLTFRKVLSIGAKDKLLHNMQNAFKKTVVGFTKRYHF